jgi:IclR family acetate operon transcriptional repressor
MEGGSAGRGQAVRPGSQAIERALAVLDCFMDGQAELGVTGIARRLGLSVSTAHRIVRALVGAGYLAQNPQTDRYHLGRSAVLLGQAAQRALGLELVLPVLEEVAETTGESVNFGVLDGDAAVIQIRIESRHPLRFEQAVGTRVGLYCSALGKALLAFSPEPAAVLRRLPQFEAHTPYTLTTHAALERDLALTRQRGYSLDEQETQVGVRCIGSPVLDASGFAQSAIAVQIPTVRMPKEKLPEVAPLVLDAAERISGLSVPTAASDRFQATSVGPREAES